MERDWGALNVVQLKEELTSRGLPTTGKKKDFIERLQALEAGGDPVSAEDIISEINEIAAGGDPVSAEDIISEINEVAGEAAEANGNAELDGMQTKEEEMETGPEEQKEGDEGTGDGQDKEIADAEQKDSEGKVGEDEDAEQKDATVKTEGTENETAMEEEAAMEPKDYPVPPGEGLVVTLDTCVKIIIPPRDIIDKDLRQYFREKSVLVEPLKIEDLSNGTFHEFFLKCVHFHVIFQELENEKKKSENGYLEMLFSNPQEAKETVEALADLREGLKVSVISDNKSSEDEHRADMADSQEFPLKRYMYLGNLPVSATAKSLETLFPDAEYIALVHNEEGQFKGYALAQMPTEESVERACMMYRNVDFEGNNIVVLKSWFKPPKGLLDYKVRSQLLKRVRELKTKIKGWNRTVPMKNPVLLRKMENEMGMIKQRLDKDCQVRDEIGLPSPADVVHREKILADQDLKKTAGDSESDSTEAPEKKKVAKIFTPVSAKKTFQQKSRGSWKQQQGNYSRRGGASDYNSQWAYYGGGVRGGGSSGGGGGVGGRFSGQSYGGTGYQQPQKLDQALGLLQNLSHMIGGGMQGGARRGMGRGAAVHGAGAGYQQGAQAWSQSYGAGAGDSGYGTASQGAGNYADANYSAAEGYSAYSEGYGGDQAYGGAGYGGGAQGYGNQRAGRGYTRQW